MVFNGTVNTFSNIAAVSFKIKMLCFKLYINESLFLVHIQKCMLLKINCKTKNCENFN